MSKSSDEPRKKSATDQERNPRAAARSSWQTIYYGNSNALGRIKTESKYAVIISSFFNKFDKQDAGPRQVKFSEKSRTLLVESMRVLKRGGLLFIYGPPQLLPCWGQGLMLAADDETRMVFKYWIALDIDATPASGFLKPSHLGLLLFMKDRSGKKTPARFGLNTNAARVPHASCAACGLNLKDWGGKKHLMNPRGAVLSDVWRDLPRRPIRDNLLPKDVLNRIRRLTGYSGLHIVQENPATTYATCSVRQPVETVDDNPMPMRSQALSNSWSLRSLETGRVFLDDCVPFLRKVKALYPEGVFDLAFADPPYNLEKGYNNYADALAEQHYIEWCNAWLEGMAHTLKPGGSLLVLNLPKWAIHHAAFLNRHLEFRHWIAWDALSDPRGKLMPAHYALLYYTKRGGKPVFNYAPMDERRKEDFVPPPDSPKYCLRAGCIKGRKARGDDEKVELSDIWFDIHRIKHKRDRDAHPCQLPEKLLERIIRLTTQPGGLVFDPFCGAGTTAIAATKLGRKFVVVDMDENYVRITREKLAAMKQHAKTNGEFNVPRNSIQRPRGGNSKRGIELYLQNLALRLRRVPTETDVAADRPEILCQIDLTYPTRGAAFKRAKVVLGKAA